MRAVGCLVGLLVVMVAFSLVPVATAGTGARQLLAWGDNYFGQLGNGSTTNSDVPVQVKLPKGTKVTAIAAGVDHSLALTSTGAVLAWGAGGFGQLGHRPPKENNVPVKVQLPKGVKVTAISAGGDFSLALTSTGAVLAWGNNQYDQLGDGRHNSQSDVPVKVKLPKGIKVRAIAAGDTHCLAVTSSGSVLAWGSNLSGALGDGGTKASDVPVKVKLPKGVKVTRVAAGSDDSLALTSGGSVLAWGYNHFGQLGDGSTTSHHLPVEVKLPKAAKVTAIAAGYVHTLALTSSGSVLAWGYNRKGELGDGNRTDSHLPVKVKLPKGIKATQVAAGVLHSLALTKTGALLAWGAGGKGELGDGSTSNSDLPVQVMLPTGTVATALGPEPDAHHSLALVRHG